MKKGKKLTKTSLPHYKIPIHSVEPQDYGKELEPGLPSKDLKDFDNALSKMRDEIFHENSETSLVSYFMTIDGTINFTTEEVISVKMEETIRTQTHGYTTKKNLEAHIEIKTDHDGANTLSNICQRLNNKHHYTLRVFKNGILSRTIQFYDTILSDIFSEVNIDGSVTNTLTLIPTFWDM